jgi:hypothetical protein
MDDPITYEKLIEVLEIIADAIRYNNPETLEHKIHQLYQDAISADLQRS